MSNRGNVGNQHRQRQSVVQTVYPIPQGVLPNVGPQEGSKNTYIVIVNKGDGKETDQSSIEPHTIKPSFKLKKGLPKVRLKMRHSDGGDYDDISSKFSIQKRGVGDVKMNLSDIGFEDYDSTTTAQSVFRDECEEIKNYELSSKIISTDMSEIQKSSNMLSINQIENSDPFRSPTLGSVPFVKAKIDTPVTKMDLSGSSGYNSACSPFLRSTFETPSPFSIAYEKESAARQILLISPNQQNSEQISGASPISFISAGLKNVAVLQSPSEVCSTRTHPLGFQSTPINSSSVQTVAINPSFLTSTPITQTLTSSQTEALASVKPFNVKLPILKHGQVSVSPTFEKTELADEVYKRKSNDEMSEISQSSKSKSERMGDVVMHFDFRDNEASVKIENIIQQENADIIASSQESLPSSSQESMDSQESTVSEKEHVESLDDSLTNIQWLRGIKLKKEVKEESSETVSNKTKDKDGGNNNPLQWRYLSPADIKRIAQECGKTKRPPFSYMSLIQMALNSTEEKKMTLREICKWIETTFPFYKFTAKPGWKNSIRHNLSLYSIFEREKSKKHGSYWTMREDCPEKTKVIPANKDIKKDSSVSGMGAHLASMIPLMPASFFRHSQAGLKLPLPPAGSVPTIPFPHSTGMPTIPVIRDASQRKGPQPILPRPYMFGSAPMQTYALIPIQNMGQNMQMGNGQNQPMMMQVPSDRNTQTAVSSSNTQQDDDQVNIQRRIKKKKVLNIAPKATSTATNDRSVNIVRQAWLDAQNLTSDSETERATSKIACKIEDRFEVTNTNDDTMAKKAKVKLTLPKPKFFSRKTPPNKKTRSRRKQKLIPKERSLMQDSSDEETDFVTNLEKELPTPLRNILDKNEVESETMATSTPFKTTYFSSPQLPSPIRGLTPLKNTMLGDGMFLDCFKDSDSDGKGFVISPDILRSKKTSPSLLRTPDTPQLDLNFTPVKSLSMQDTSNNGHSLSKFIAEFPIDSQLMEEGDGLPADLSNLNWSVGQQTDDS